MANPAQQLEHTTNYLTQRDIFIFDGNSRSAHKIALTILVHDQSQKFDLVPKQNAPFFGIELPEAHREEKFILVMQTGEILNGKTALDFISHRLKLQAQVH